MLGTHNVRPRSNCEMGPGDSRPLAIAHGSSDPRESDGNEISDGYLSGFGRTCVYRWPAGYIDVDDVKMGMCEFREG